MLHRDEFTGEYQLPNGSWVDDPEEYYEKQHEQYDVEKDNQLINMVDYANNLMANHLFI